MALSGSCLCGAVRFSIAGTLDHPVACHCGQCRKASGNHVAAGRCAESELTMIADETLRWFESSPGVRRGFCGTCGSPLFWKNESSPNISVGLGALDGETGLRLAGHIFCAHKGDWEEIPAAPPAWAEGDGEGATPWTGETR